MPDSQPNTSATASSESAPEADDPRLDDSRELERPDTIPAHMQEAPDEQTELYNRIVDSLSDIYDPEIPVNIFDLGLIYNIDIHDDAHVDVLMTLTAPNCPAAGILPGQAEDAVRLTEGVKSVYLELTFHPPFSPQMMSEEAQLELGFM
jgi:FeS assembly SUF system protein